MSAVIIAALDLLDGAGLRTPWNLPGMVADIQFSQLRYTEF